MLMRSWFYCAQMAVHPTLQRLAFNLALAVFLFLPLTAPAQAQTYPDYASTTVNDFAELLDDAAEARLTRSLLALRQQTGIEMTVVTLPSQTPYAPDLTMEQFATGLFNHWGVGHAGRNDGIMVLVLPQDRVMRVELGAGYGPEWNSVAQSVIDTGFLPSLRENRFQQGIELGTAEVISRIAQPFAEGRPAPKAAEKGDDPMVLFGFLAVIASVMAWNARRVISDLTYRWRRCPQCGQRSLKVQRKTLSWATKRSAGRGERRVRCSNCDYRQTSLYVIPRLGSSSSGRSSFGGGRSSGGGASGRF